MAITKVNAQGSKVDLTLQSIHGIHCNANGSNRYPPEVKASVSFTGSASEMQVSSFNMCGRTGNLVIESNVLEVAPPSNDREDVEVSRCKKEEYQLLATFNDPLKSRKSLKSCSVSKNSSGSSQRPHLKLELSQTNPNNPKRTLGSVNRAPSNVHDTELSTVDTDGHSLLSGDKSRGGSLHWEAESGAMPDIVELNVALRNQDNVVCNEGIAHLVFYGSKRELGSTTMDLRIKKKDPLNQEGSASLPELSFTEDAFVRVQVQVTSADHPTPSPEEMPLSENFDERKIGKIMLKLREHEEMAAARAKVHRMTIKQEEAGKNAPRKMFCNVGLEFKETFRAIVDALSKCEGRRQKRSTRKKFMPLLRANSTMDSTIETRDSMLI